MIRKRASHDYAEALRAAGAALRVEKLPGDGRPSVEYRTAEYQLSTDYMIHTLDPGARLVLVDNHPLVLTHAAARLRGPRPQLTAVIEADLREPETILGHPEVRAVLDLDRPVGLLLGFAVHFLTDRDQPADMIRTLMRALAPGSVLVLSHATAQGQSELALAAAERYRCAGMPVTLRTPAQITGFFDGLELLEPGVVAQPWWRPDEEPTEDPELNWGCAGLARKP